MSAPAAEFAGTALLLYVVVGSGVNLAGPTSDPGLVLVGHALAVGIALVVLVILFAEVSGSHFNPAVTVALWRKGVVSGRRAGMYVLAQLGGAVVGVLLAHVSFGHVVVEVATSDRAGVGTFVAEVIGTMVLVLGIMVMIDRGRTNVVPVMVGCWVAVAIISTSSTGFLNPAATAARVLTDTYTGLAPSSVPVLVGAQFAGAAIAVFLCTQLTTKEAANASHAHH